MAVDSDMEQLLTVMAALRDPRRGCPWDCRQTMGSLVGHTLEEAYEVVDAVEQGCPEAIREELGDLLFQVIFYSRIAEEQGWFDFAAVVARLADKLIRRHPHVFGEAHTGSAEAQAWEAHKQREREGRAAEERPGALDGVPLGLPALIRAVKLQRRAAGVGFDWPDAQRVLAKVEEELAELRAELATSDLRRLEHELGDLLLAASNLARHLGIDPETALRRANRRFEQRFQYMESRLAVQGRAMASATEQELDAFWEEAKRGSEFPVSGE